MGGPRDPSLGSAVEAGESLRRSGSELDEVCHLPAGYSMPRRFLTSATGIGASSLASNFARAAFATAASRRSSTLAGTFTTGAGFVLGVG